MDKEILLSVVVPTKDRYYYLKHLMQLIKSFNSDEIEMVVQDNTKDNSEILEYISSEGWEGLKYFHTKEQITVSENADRAILNSSGEYVCFIGDDDGVTRNIIDCVKWMKKNDFKILKSSLSIFKWPSFVSYDKINLSATLLYNEFSCKYRVISCKESLEDLIRRGMDTLSNMPKVYNGIVERKLLNKVYEKCNTFHPGPSPDMANAVALSLMTESFVLLDYPIIIAGHSINTGGNAARYKKGLGPLEEQPFISQEYKDNWSLKIPKVWCSETVWPESAITALKSFGEDDYLKKIDFDTLLRKFSVIHPEYINMALSLSDNRTKLFFSIIYHRIINALVLAKTHLSAKKDKYGGLTIHHGFNDIIDAENHLFSISESFNPQKAE